MKKRKMLHIVSLADDRFIEEADPTRNRVTPKRKSFRLSTVAACAACLLLLLNLIIFVPFLTRDNVTDNPTDNSINHTQNPPNGTEGTDLIVNENILGILDRLFASGGVNITPGLGDLSDSVQDSLEKEESNEESKEENNFVDSDINDNQVTGVSEGDIVKRSKNHIFYLANGELNIYSIDKENSKLVCKLSLVGYVNDLSAYKSTSQDSLEEESKVDEEIEDVLPDIAEKSVWQMYLSSEGNILTIIVQPRGINVSAVFTVDVSQAPTVKLADYRIFAGSYISSRVIDNEMLLFTRYPIHRGYSKEKPSSYMPFIKGDEGERIIENLYYPQALHSSSYVVLTRINVSTGKPIESSAFLGYSDNLYVSQGNIYLTRQRNLTFASTEIVRVEYAQGRFNVKGLSTVLGTVKDQYSLDEYKNVLRVVTTVEGKIREDGIAVDTRTNASLYCVDINTMKIISKVEHFAPYGDIVRSARFDKDYAYICTSLLLTDPVFFFDLSDPYNIPKPTDTGIIDGYSSSLINLNNGFVLGIGYGDSTSTLKIEVYKEIDGSVVSQAVYESQNTAFSEDYKSYYINRELNLIGLGTKVNKSSRYLLLYFDGNSLIPVIDQELSYTHTSLARGFYEDSFFYTVSDQGLWVTDIGNMEKTNNG